MSLEWTIIDGDGGHEAPVALELLASTATCRLTFRAAGPLGQPPLAALTGALDAEVFGPALTEAVAELKKTEAYKRLIYLNREVGVYLQFAKSAAKKIAKLEKERQDLEKSSEPNLYAKLRAIDNQLAELKKEHRLPDGAVGPAVNPHQPIAYLAYKAALEESPELAKLRDREMFDWMMSRPEYAVQIPHHFETAYRYIAAGRKFYGCVKRPRKS